MRDFDAIQEHIRRAQAERSLFIATLIADAIVATWNGVKSLSLTILTASHVRREKIGDYTFDA